MKQIESIIEELESDELDLDESIKKYEIGMSLIEKCKKILKESKLKIEILRKKEDKEIEYADDGKDVDEEKDVDENDENNNPF
ncbi:MAG: exodeoxyribonuclease VII small subunit [Candidatus Goldbacteria bacterium]|nr:exodeoxyribonuclease VII small subunit [Candidatus Goldiibacteriota bacterium]